MYGSAPSYTQRLGFTLPVLHNRLEYFKVDAASLSALRQNREIAQRLTGPIVDAFYEHLLGYPETREFLADPNLVARLKKTQESYFLEFFDGEVDLDYVERRLKIGAVHERLGVPPRWYIGAYSRYLTLSHEAFHRELDPATAQALSQALERIMHFDAALAIDAYIAAHMETVNRQQEAIRELSTPVIKVQQGVLMLPLVGTLDSRRAQQVMESVLERISEEQARVLILDIAGVAVVDTQVADHLLKTTAAVRLLGAQTVLTGISPQVARTMVDLGVNVGTMHTRNKLSDGLELALDLVGLQIRKKA